MATLGAQLAAAQQAKRTAGEERKRQDASECAALARTFVQSHRAQIVQGETWYHLGRMDANKVDSLGCSRYISKRTQHVLEDEQVVAEFVHVGGDFYVSIAPHT